MTEKRWLGLTAAAWRLAIVAGIAIGVVYALSPLTVWFSLAMTLLVRSAVSGLDEDERRRVQTILILAIGLRVLAVAGLFLTTNHTQVPFGSFFGDEEYFIKRSIWLRNVALGIPIHGADLIYAFDDYSATSYLYVLAFVQVLVGPAPYGVHLLSVACYVAATVLLFRMVRTTLGRAPAILGLSLLLFLPSLFAWSISALKEPLFFVMTAASVVMTMKVITGPRWVHRIVAAAAIAVLAAALETVRAAGAALSAASLLLGLSAGYLARRPRMLLSLVMVTPIVAGLALNRPAAQVKVYAALQAAAKQHWGHIATAGYVYTTLDERFYPDKSEIGDIGFLEAGRFAVRSLERYVTVPFPWEVQSKAALAYLPEQIVWYGLVVFAPFGLLFAFRRNAIATGVLLGHALVGGVTVAFISGNVGTLVRHRGLALPYFVWLSAVGICELLTRGGSTETGADREWRRMPHGSPA